MKELSKHTKQAKHRACAALMVCLVILFAPVSRSVAQEKPSAHKAVIVEIGQFVRAAIPVNQRSIAFNIDVPVAGVFGFNVRPESKNEIYLMVFNQDGELLGVDGALLKEPGVVRAEIIRIMARDKDKALPIEVRFVLLENNPDIFEPNGKLEMARTLDIGPDHPIAGGAAMLFPKKDVDWFRLAVSAPGWLTPFIMKSADNKTRITITTEAGQTLAFGQPISVEAGTSSFKIRSTHSSFELIEISFEYAPVWDDCKYNIHSGNACALVHGKPINFTLFPIAKVNSGIQESVTKWFSFETPMPGYILLSVSRMPRPKFDSKNKLISGLKLNATAFLIDKNKHHNAEIRILDRAVVVLAAKPGTYNIGLGGEWAAVSAQRAMKLAPRFRKQVVAKAGQSKFTILGMLAPGNKSDPSALGLALLADIGEGDYGDARTSEQIRLAVKKFIGGRDAKRNKPDADKQSHPPTRHIQTIIAQKKAKGTQSIKQAAKRENVELVRLLKLRAYLSRAKGNFLYRHHFRTPSGEILKRLEKTKLPGKGMAKHVRTKTEQLSPVISRRLLARNIQNLE